VSIFYTYVIVENKLQFSETGSSFVKDFSSKHAMHAKCSKSVYYAGEFHIRPGNHGGYKLVIDNNSGTYAPKKEHLGMVKELMEKNFPGLEVEALAYDDPILIEYKKNITFQ